ncbi:MAG TPA: FixH family protein [Silvibacterium sp.]|nr:FixH family protein [Silvibacterium sp.]
MTGRIAGGRRVAAPQFCRGLLALACLGTLAATACHQANDGASDISVQQQITPQPVHVGPATVAVQLADAAAKPVSDATIMVEADMSHPGMSPVFGAAGKTGPGSYQAHINFNMGGDWVVLLHIKLADGRKIERQVDVRGVRTN